MSNLSQPPVLVDTLATESGHQIGLLTLNAPKTLNSLSELMCQQLSEQLSLWQSDANVVAVVLTGVGDKAFCAGGNIKALYDSIDDDSSGNSTHPNPVATRFFASEYRLYRQMHFYNKPLVLWGDGIIMGGGMGLMAACSHRVVTERTRFAMPEISIGLFPDATGSWFLQRMPAKTGLFMGLTGAHGNAYDALMANLAEYVADSQHNQRLLQLLCQANWQMLPKAPRADAARLGVQDRHAHRLVSTTLDQLPKAALDLPNHLGTHALATNQLLSCGGLPEINAALQDDAVLASISAPCARMVADDWVQQALHTYRQGCPVTAALTYQLYQRAPVLSLEQILYTEATVAAHCASRPDFKEGVRALLIDKDKSPQWSMTHEQCASDAGQAYIEAHFVDPYPASSHPFADWLGEQALANRAVR